MADIDIDIDAHDKTGAATASAARNLDNVDRSMKKVNRSSTDVDRSMTGMARSAESSLKKVRKGADDADDGLKKTAKSAERTTSMMTTLGAKLLGGGGAVLGLVAFKFAADAAASSLVLGFGAAMTAVGIIAVAKTKVVSDAFSKLWNDVRNQTETMSAPFVPVLTGIAAKFRTVFAGLAPDLTIMFRKLAPALDVLSGFVAKALLALRPAIQPLTDGFARLAEAMGPALVDASKSVASGLKAVGDELNRNPQGLANLITDLGKLTEGVLKTGAFLNDFTGKLHDNAVMVTAWGEIALGKALSNQLLVNHAMKAGQGAYRDLHPPLVAVTQATISDAEAQAVLAEQTQRATDAANKQRTAQLALIDANIGLEQSIDDATKAAKENGKTAISNGHALDINTQKGRNNMRALQTLAAATNTAAQASRDNGDAVEVTNGKLSRGRTALIRTAEKMGLTASEAKKLADKIIEIPTTHATKIKADAAAAQETLRETARLLAELHNKTIHIRATASGPGFRPSGGPNIAIARGGVVREHIRGVGLQSGRQYDIGEAGPEAVVPLSGGRGLTAGIGGGAAAGGISITLVAPNYIGSRDELQRGLLDMARSGQLKAVLRTAGVAA